MSEMQVLSETPINTFQLRKEIEKIRKRDNELNFRANRAEEFLQQLDFPKNADDLFEKILKLSIPRLREQHIHKIIDIMPTTQIELKAVLQGYTITINNESIKKIVDVISEFLEKK